MSKQRSSSRTSDHGFSIVEILVIVGVMAVIAFFSIPLFDRTLFRNDLGIAKSQITQGLETARLNGMAGKYDSPWTFFVPKGVVFPGTDYVTDIADPNVEARAVTFSMPDTVQYSGLEQVTYGRSGRPNISGIINLNLVDDPNARASVTVSDTSITNFNTSSSAGSSSSAGIIFNPCPIYSKGTDNVLTIASNANLTMLNLAALRKSAGVYVSTYNCHSTNLGFNYSTTFGAPATCTGIEYGTPVNTAGGESQTIAVGIGDKLVLKVRNYLRQAGSLTINDIYDSKTNASRFWFLLNGDSAGPDSSHTNSSALTSLLQARGYISGGVVALGACELILVTEMDDLHTSRADYIDSVLRLSFF